MKSDWVKLKHTPHRKQRHKTHQKCVLPLVVNLSYYTISIKNDFAIVHILMKGLYLTTHFNTKQNNLLKRLQSYTFI